MRGTAMSRARAKKVRGKLLEIDAPTAEEREWIFEALAEPEVHVPLSCREAPARALFDSEQLEFWRGDAMRREAVRYHILRRLEDGRPVGFFLDFGWDYPHDPTREIDLVFPDPRHRGIGSYLDATVIVAQYLFRSGLAKRLRWRVDVRPGQEPRRGTRQGARFLHETEERHPVTGEWLTRYIYEYALADFEALGERVGVDPRQDYADLDASLFASYRQPDGD
jgi:RimJ/RimL family protein N-acetyltransferase